VLQCRFVMKDAVIYKVNAVPVDTAL